MTQEDKDIFESFAAPKKKTKKKITLKKYEISNLKFPKFSKKKSRRKLKRNLEIKVK